MILPQHRSGRRRNKERIDVAHAQRLPVLVLFTGRDGSKALGNRNSTRHQWAHRDSTELTTIMCACSLLGMEPSSATLVMQQHEGVARECSWWLVDELLVAWRTRYDDLSRASQLVFNGFGSLLCLLDVHLPGQWGIVKAWTGSKREMRTGGSHRLGPLLAGVGFSERTDPPSLINIRILVSPSACGFVCLLLFLQPHACYTYAIAPQRLGAGCPWGTRKRPQGVRVSFLRHACY